MMNGSSHDWKLTTIRKYTRRIAKQIPSAIWKNDCFMLWTWPRTLIVLAFESVALYFAMIVSTASDTEPRSVP